MICIASVSLCFWFDGMILNWIKWLVYNMCIYTAIRAITHCPTWGPVSLCLLALCLDRSSICHIKWFTAPQMPSVINQSYYNIAREGDLESFVELWLKSKVAKVFNHSKDFNTRLAALFQKKIIFIHVKKRIKKTIFI